MTKENKIAELSMKNNILEKNIKEIYDTAKKSAINAYNHQKKQKEYPEIKYFQGREEFALKIVDLIEVLMNW